MNLFSLPTRKWDKTLLLSVTEGNQAEADRLEKMLGQVHLDPREPCGTIGDWYAQRYGFNKDCLVVPFTGDNPATLLSFTLKS